MAFAKGQSGNPKGRKRGSRNKVTQTLKEFFADVIDSNREQIITDLGELNAKERLQIIIGLLPYIIPKQNQVIEEVSEVTKGFKEWKRVQNMTDKELNEELSRLREATK